MLELSLLMIMRPFSQSPRLEVHRLSSADCTNVEAGSIFLRRIQGSSRFKMAFFLPALQL